MENEKIRFKMRTKEPLERLTITPNGAQNHEKTLIILKRQSLPTGISLANFSTIGQDIFTLSFVVYYSDVDECADDSHNCVDDATCKNTVGSFNCTCDVGMVGDGSKNGTKCAGECYIACYLLNR